MKPSRLQLFLEFFDYWFNLITSNYLFIFSISSWLNLGRFCVSRNLLISFYLSNLLVYNCSSIQFSRSVVSDSLLPHELQHTRPPCPSPTLGVHPDSRPSSQWCHPAISSSVIPFSSCPQSLPASESFPMSQLFCIFVLLLVNSLSFMILFIWPPSVSFLMNLAKGLSILFMVSKNQLFVLLIFSFFL